ncbi:MAG: hypothetical protein K2F79_05235, partial [Muribaculaceae bacterium]|nr:hypothetical protein [Muribaculaceae bacterium]
MASEKVHLFFPENDLALALDLTNYTPPPAAVRLRRSGEALPLWYGAEGDSFISTGVNAEWLDKMRSLFGMGVGVYGYDASGCVAAPWGWSKASRKVYADRGFAPADLPDDARLERIRELSHRRSSVFIGERLARALSFPLAPVARECRTYADVEAFVAANGESVLKLPWSSSGRGLVRTDRSTLEGQRRMVEGMIRRQGSVMAEKFLEKSKDFAMLFTAEGGCCRYEGLSLFTTDRVGSYSGNELAAQDELGRRIGCPVLGELSELLPGILQELIGDAYQGPLGVDM